MSDDPYADRKQLTFEQAEGVEPLPTQMQPKQMSPELSARLWAVIHESINRNLADDNIGYSQSRLGEAWTKILRDYHVDRLHLSIDEYDNASKKQIAVVKAIVRSNNYARVFGFVQFALRHPRVPAYLRDVIAEALTTSRAAYRIFDGDTIVPISSDTERRTLDHAFANLSSAEFNGARAHLREAGAALTAGDYPASIRESIHAVESVARSLEPTGSLAAALGRLEKSAAIHGALKHGFASIYGYTSDQQGIRHPLIDEASAKVDETDAIFMIGACAAFVSYLIGKARSASLLTKDRR